MSYHSRVSPLNTLASVFIAASVFATTDSQPHSSPDAAYSVVNVGDSSRPDHHFQIVARDGAVLLSSDAAPPLESGSFATSIQWSPDSRFIAFSVRTSGPYIQ